ncbi:hypothetical protein [Paraglaciecola agarilytica]|nr:hypothetical protein [Paraglaciecola agarilytica]|tara:strand:+ start:6919 stop:7059 length:141 start_codon:yes stop_codon:yes gene_type:complete
MLDDSLEPEKSLELAKSLEPEKSLELAKSPEPNMLGAFSCLAVALR